MPEGWVWDEIETYRLDKTIIVEFLKEIFGWQNENNFGVYVGLSSEQKH
jgi:hypothetical protein